MAKRRRNLNPGEVEMILIVEEAVINGPNHRSLGTLHAGDSFVTAEGPYADSLRTSNIAVYISDFKPSMLTKDALKDLDDQIKAATAEEAEEADGEEEETGDGPPRLVPETQMTGRGRKKAL